jgi:four helix bundle protein
MNPKTEALKARTKKFALAACRARSDAEFAAKIGLVLEEADESLFWMELFEARSLGSPQLRTALLQEAGELTAIFAASSITIRRSIGRSQK